MEDEHANKDELGKILHEFANCTYPHPSTDYFCSWCDRLPKALQAIIALIDKLVIEARIDEAEKLMGYSKTMPEVTIVYPKDRDKYREFSRVSVVMAKYASDRLATLKNTLKDKEGE